MGENLTPTLQLELNSGGRTHLAVTPFMSQNYINNENIMLVKPVHVIRIQKVNCKLTVIV